MLVWQTWQHMQSLCNFVLLIFCSILAANYHVVHDDKRKLEHRAKMLEDNNTSLWVEIKQLHDQVRIAESKANKCVQVNDACQQQMKEFEILKKNSKVNDDKIDHLGDQLQRLKMKKNHFQSLLNTTQQVYLADQLRRLKLKKKHDLTDRLRRLKLKKKYFQSLLNTTQQVKDEGQPVECVCEEVQPVQCAVEKNLDYAQTYICVVGASIFCLVCVCMHVLWNLSDKSDDVTAVEIESILETSNIRLDSNGRLVFDEGGIHASKNVLQALTTSQIEQILRGTSARRQLFLSKKPKKDKEKSWAAYIASNWNKLQAEDIESNMTSTANFYPNPHDYAESKFNRNPVNKHGRFLDEYRAIPE